MTQKTFWTVFAVLVGIVAVLFIVNAVTSNQQEPAAPGAPRQSAEANLPLPDDITNPGETEDKQVTADSFPETIDGLTLTGLLTGQEAVDDIKKLHLDAFTPSEGFVATYHGSDDAMAQVWVSVAASEDEAKAQIEDMHQKIGSSPAFTNHQVLPIGPIMYHYVQGMGQEHFFYYRGDDVIWIAISDHQLLTLFTKIL